MCFLEFLVGFEVIAKSIWGPEYKGILMSVDKDLNIQLSNTEESVNGVVKGNIGEVFIKITNLLYIKVDSKQKDPVEERGEGVGVEE